MPIENADLRLPRVGVAEPLRVLLPELGGAQRRGAAARGGGVPQPLPRGPTVRRKDGSCLEFFSSDLYLYLLTKMMNW